MKLSATLLAAVVVLGSVSLAQAQFPTPIVPMPGTTTQVYPEHRAYWDGVQMVRGVRPGISSPVMVTPERFNGWTPWGGINTRNEQVNNTYFDYGRHGSQYNGSRRWVNGPVYDSYGRITGYQEGYIWNNSLTGQEHGNVKTVTPNGHGGQVETATLYSTAGEGIAPKNVGN